MNSEDLIPIAGKKMPIRVLLDIMNLEAELKGASYWGTYLLYYAFDTNDSELRGEVERRLQTMGQAKYEREKHSTEEEVTPPQAGMNKLNQDQIYFALRCAIYELMELKDEKDKYLFQHQNQWTAIFWCIVDLSIGIFGYQYDDFRDLISKLNLVDIRVKFVITSINDCTHTDYKDVPSLWVCTKNKSRGTNAFKKMKKIAEEFQKLLAKHGLKRPDNPS